MLSQRDLGNTYILLLEFWLSDIVYGDCNDMIGRHVVETRRLLVMLYAKVYCCAHANRRLKKSKGLQRSLSLFMQGSILDWKTRSFFTMHTVLICEGASPWGREVGGVD